ncbi:DUF4127 family protein [Microbacterium sp. 4R-513]|uniref:DUF4127 family protein n=1 Tax=Microbacterium sp. 4R-513 TaxID=2567934 RepID=UPI0013E12DDA|nr:DUF4127 family protein [Microbacterium sp. 4R-513]QIG40964.1 DUF4127 family protein [Microbacterium sp. 4R-513]
MSPRDDETSHAMKILLVPLDERPVSLELPGLVASIAGARVVTPPRASLPAVRAAGDVDALAAWLEREAHDADGLVVSLEGLGFGGLIPSRIGVEPIEVVLDRWAVLRRLDLPIHASVVVPRSPDSDDAFEEPEYWSEWGHDLHDLSTAMVSGAEAPATAVPESVRTDWLGRRLRQHAIGLAALGLVADGTIARLVIGVDDAAPGSLSSEAQADLARWASRLGLQDRVVVGPGADETAAVLTARLLAERTGIAPRVSLMCASPDGLARVAPYETGPVEATAHGQLRAAGASVDGGEPDGVLIVHAPQGADDWAVAPPATTDAGAALRTVELAREQVASGRAVAVADVAQPNGADPALVQALLAAGLFDRLEGFAAWNTAGNTIGTAAASLIAGLVGRSSGTYDPRAADRHRRLRLIEDAAYMSVARAELRAERGTRPDRHDRIDDTERAAERVSALLNDALVRLGAADVATVAADQVSFPWARSFEIALDPEAGRP